MGTHPIFESDFDCLTVMVKREKPASSRSKAMITVARQNASELLSELKVDLGGGYCVVSPVKDEDLRAFGFDLTKANMHDLYEAAPEWGWSDTDKEKEFASEHQHMA